MASWLLSLWLLIMEPCCPVVRTRCPELGWWLRAAANGKKGRTGNSDLQQLVLIFKKYLGAQMGIAGAHSWRPASPPHSLALVIRSGLTPGHAGPFPPRMPPEALPPALPSSGQHGVSLVSSGAVDSPRSHFPAFWLSWTLLCTDFLGWIPCERFCPGGCLK